MRTNTAWTSRRSGIGNGHVRDRVARACVIVAALRRSRRSEVMPVETSEQLTLKTLQEKATQLRIDSVRATTEAGSGHPTSCASAAEIMSVLFYSVMRYDPHDPRRPDNDLFVLSKGHAGSYPLCCMVRSGRFSTREAHDFAQDRLGP